MEKKLNSELDEVRKAVTKIEFEIISFLENLRSQNPTCYPIVKALKKNEF